MANSKMLLNEFYQRHPQLPPPIVDVYSDGVLFVCEMQLPEGCVCNVGGA